MKTLLLIIISSFLITFSGCIDLSVLFKTLNKNESSKQEYTFTYDNFIITEQQFDMIRDLEVGDHISELKGVTPFPINHNDFYSVVIGSLGGHRSFPFYQWAQNTIEKYQYYNEGVGESISEIYPMTPQGSVYILHYRNDKLVDIQDPWGGMRSSDTETLYLGHGAPATPVLHSYLQDAITFHTSTHMTQAIDIRWEPVRAQYPMVYEVEIIDPHSKDITIKRTFNSYVTLSPHNMGTYKYRIRAKNSKGLSEWSRYFEIHYITR